MKGKGRDFLVFGFLFLIFWLNGGGDIRGG